MLALVIYKLQNYDTIISRIYRPVNIQLFILVLFLYELLKQYKKYLYSMRQAPQQRQRRAKQLVSPGAGNSKKLCNLFCVRKPKRKRRRQLLQSYLMAHAQIRLVLLHPCPDTVHGNALHKTLLSTPLTACGPSIGAPERDIRLCCSGLQIQGTADSPPSTVRSLYTNFLFLASVLPGPRQDFFLKKEKRLTILS